jgi:hypothetical protein
MQNVGEGAQQKPVVLRREVNLGHHKEENTGSSFPNID